MAHYQKTTEEALQTCRDFLLVLNEKPEVFAKVIPKMEEAEQRLKDATMVKELKESWRS